MQQKIDPFSRVASDRVLPDRQPLPGCLRRSVFGDLSRVNQVGRATTPNSGLRPGPSAIQYRRVTTCTRELDGAKGIDGG
jgi:hypothetical protein